MPASFISLSLYVCVCVCLYVFVYVCVCKYVGIYTKSGEKREFLALGLLLGCFCISRKNAVGGRMLVTARAAPKSQTSLLWFIIHIFAGREGKVIPWCSLYGCFLQPCA